ncbi:hypothetical protein AAL_02868 [Moelleriella libera RCEF 2490]|uniref:Uncharacterized protein n=1 Tax=Moelleriella libera RCEF 2490 TaxID=1081109 RepID=A0A166PQ54_9HYPO|nr:hypothetical protein AAL_02868 [Moelleriella libera RCEF 2490]
MSIDLTTEGSFGDRKWRWVGRHLNDANQTLPLPSELPCAAAVAAAAALVVVGTFPPSFYCCARDSIEGRQRMEDYYKNCGRWRHLLRTSEEALHRIRLAFQRPRTHVYVIMVSTMVDRHLAKRKKERRGRPNEGVAAAAALCLPSACCAVLCSALSLPPQQSSAERLQHQAPQQSARPETFTVVGDSGPAGLYQRTRFAEMDSDASSGPPFFPPLLLYNDRQAPDRF